MINTLTTIFLNDIEFNLHPFSSVYEDTITQKCLMRDIQLNKWKHQVTERGEERTNSNSSQLLSE